MTQDLTDYLRQEFLRRAVVENAKIGFIEFEEFKFDPHIIALTAQVIAQHCRDQGIRADVVVGVARSGLPLAKEVAHALKLPYVGSWKDQLPAEKRPEDCFAAHVQHSFTTQGQPPATIFFPKLPGQQEVLIGEDVVAHGYTGEAVIQAFRGQGHKVVIWNTQMAKLFQRGVKRIRGLGVPVYAVLPVQAIGGSNQIVLA